jgi:hypothetical protein
VRVLQIKKIIEAVPRARVFDKGKQAEISFDAVFIRNLQKPTLEMFA